MLQQFLLIGVIAFACVSNATESFSCAEGNGATSLKNELLYPEESRKFKEEGKVTLKVLVDKTGHLAKIVLYESSGYSRLDESAIEYVKSFCFIPATKAGEPFDACVMVPINFKLDH
jgi:TonB family protein